MELNRKVCRICADRAGYTRNICSGCHAAEIERHLKEAALSVLPTKGQSLQDAYGKAVVTEPVVR